MKQSVSEKKLKAFQENLPKLRKKYGVSQTELAYFTGISRYSIIKYEKGTMQLKQPYYMAICMAFHQLKTNAQ